MRVLLVTQSTSESPKTAALIKILESKLKQLVRNSYEVVIRDINSLVDHIYDDKNPSLRVFANKQVSKHNKFHNFRGLISSTSSS